MKFFLILVLWCTVNIVTSEEQNDEKHQSAENYVDPIQEPLRLTSFENLGKDYGLNPPPSSFEIEAMLYDGESDLTTGKFAYDFTEFDYLSTINTQTSNMQIELGFALPFYGSRYRSVHVSLDGTVAFSELPNEYSESPQFPHPDWPHSKDPPLIGILLAKSKIGELHPNDTDLRKPGVYARVSQNDGLRKQVRHEIRNGIVGSNDFDPFYTVIVTWKNVTYTKDNDTNSNRTNTYQLILATDEIRAYAIFNYIDLADLNDTSISHAFSPFVGFNAGNGTEATRYRPYQQTSKGFPNRHMFRIDEQIMVGTCNPDVLSKNLKVPLSIAPESGNMLGGTMVNVSGPCFERDVPVFCRFDTVTVEAQVIDRNRAVCVQPMMFAQGYINLTVSVGPDSFITQGVYYIESPETATSAIFFPTNTFFEPWNGTDSNSDADIPIQWNIMDLNGRVDVTVSLWGYVESDTGPELIIINYLDHGPFNGTTMMIKRSNRWERNVVNETNFHFGFIKVKVDQLSDRPATPSIWSKPIPLDWFLAPQWVDRYGNNWRQEICNEWLLNDRTDIFDSLPPCPCYLMQANYDKGRFIPDPDCNGNITCIQNPRAVKCFRTTQTSFNELQCCYDSNGRLMSSLDEVGGSRPATSRSFGQIPYNLNGRKVPSLSKHYHDSSLFYMCCSHDDERSENCYKLRTKHRVSSECTSYSRPTVAAVFGDPHISTFDNKRYTFNGLGDFVLVRRTLMNPIEVQGRFEMMPDNQQGRVMATRLTSIVARVDSSETIEVRLRAIPAQWQYRMDVLVDGRRIYFDSPSRRVQHFKAVTVYTPTYIFDQSHFIMMFPSGTGIEVKELNGMLSATIYLSSFLSGATTGLLGDINEQTVDQFILPSGKIVIIDPENLEQIHERFAVNWMLGNNSPYNLGNSLFKRSHGQNQNSTFVPIYARNLFVLPFEMNSSNVHTLDAVCGHNLECRFDFVMTLNEDIARSTMRFCEVLDSIHNIFNKPSISCGHLETPRNGRKLSFDMMVGAVVPFDCDYGFRMVGESFRACEFNGKWSDGVTECMSISRYDSRHTAEALGQLLLMLFSVLSVVSLLGVCIMWRKQSLTGYRYRYQQLNVDAGDDLIEWEVDRVDKQK